jgi:hypothetical protein
MRNVLAMAKLLAVPHQYCELVLMHELCVAYILEPRQFKGNLDNMMGLDIARYLALISFDKQMVDDAWVYAQQWLEDTVVLQYTTHNQVEPYLACACSLVVEAEQPHSMV